MLVNEWLEKSARSYPDKVALVCNRQRPTYREMDLSANSLGNALLEAGFRKQDRAIIFLDNSVELVISLFGVLKAGGIFVIVDPRVKNRKLDTILGNCKARVMITNKTQLSCVSEAVSNSRSLKLIIVTDDEKASTVEGPGTRPRLLSFRDILSRSRTVRPAPSCIDIDLASLIYTSGSSGSPKGVMLTHLNMESAATSIIQYLENTSDDIIINTLPMAFDYGLYQVLMAFKLGGTVVLERAFIYPQQILSRMVQEKITGWPMVPTMVALLLRLKDLHKIDLPSLRYITNTGQALPTKHISRLRETFPKVRIYSMYGLTECKRVTFLPPEELDERPRSVGKAIPNTEVYIVDGKGEEVTEPRKPGELVVRGANVMQGYWNLPKDTMTALRPGRYPGEKVLYTGDLFEMDEEGYLYFLSRKDDIIKTAGHMVSPKEVGNVLCEMEDVIEAAVVGREDDILGQAIVAHVRLTDTSKTSEKDIIDFCSERLEDYAVPRTVVLCNALPMTLTGKVKV